MSIGLLVFFKFNFGGTELPRAAAVPGIVGVQGEKEGGDKDGGEDVG